MSDPTKRSLREKRAPKNFDSDNEDKDPWGYSRPGYSKEVKNPAQQMNSDAKLLVRFISAINKCFRQYSQDPHKHQSQDIKVGRKNKTTFQIEKTSNNDHTKDTKPQVAKKARVGEGFQLQGSSNNAQSRPKIDNMLNTYKSINSESANKMLSIQYSLSNKGSLENTRTKQQKLQAAIQESEIKSKLKKNGVQTSIKPQIKSIFSNSSSSKQKSRQADSTSSNGESIIKPFKRATYHVAAAYQIYVDIMIQKGVPESEMDPLIPSKKLREKMN